MKNRNKSVLNFLLCIDHNFILGAGALIASIFEHNEDSFLRFHIFTSSTYRERAISILVPRLQHRFQVTEDNFKFYSYEDIPLFKKLKGKVNDRILVQCMRIIAVRACELTEDRLIYLDADIICNTSTKDLAFVDFKNKLLL